MLTRFFLSLTGAILLVSCAPDPPAVKTQAPVAEPAIEDDRPAIVAFGDSISAGHGVKEGSSYPDFLQRALDRLAEICRREGRARQYEVLMPLIAGMDERGSYADAAVELDSNEGAARAVACVVSALAGAVDSLPV